MLLIYYFLVPFHVWKLILKSEVWKPKIVNHPRKKKKIKITQSLLKFV